MKGYKLFRVKKTCKGQVFPLYVNANIPTPLNEWVKATEGERLPSGKVKASRLNALAFRPGWHLSDLPYATHIGVKDTDGIIKWQSQDTVWCECEYADTVNYQQEANQNGFSPKTGKFNSRDAYLKHIPVNGYYRYKTNPNMFGSWVISGSLKINKILTDTEVIAICQANSLIAMLRKEPFDLVDYGFNL